MKHSWKLFFCISFFSFIPGCFGIDTSSFFWKKKFKKSSQNMLYIPTREKRKIKELFPYDRKPQLVTVIIITQKPPFPVGLKSMPFLLFLCCRHSADEFYWCWWSWRQCEAHMGSNKRVFWCVSLPSNGCSICWDTQKKVLKVKIQDKYCLLVDLMEWDDAK